jgi:hypothetical protein
MVFHFTSAVVSPPMKLFMGFDKYESEKFTEILEHADHVDNRYFYR